MRYERTIFIAGILPSCSSLYPVLVLIRRASHICSMLEKNPQFFSPPKKIPPPLLPFALVQATQNHNLFLLQNVESGQRVLTKPGN